MTLRTRLKLPREHGAWAMLYIPFAAGLGVAGRLNIALLLTLIGITAAFIARESMTTYDRARARGRKDTSALRMLLSYTGISVLAGILLSGWYGYFWFVPLGVIGIVLLVINVRQATERDDRLIISEVLAIAGMTLTAPAAYYASSGDLDRIAFLLWVLSVAYFSSSVFYIKLRVTAAHGRDEDCRRETRRQCMAYHAFLLLGLLAMSITGSIPLFVLMAFMPVLLRTAWALLKPQKRLRLSRIGLAELAYATVFLVVTVLTIR